ncbi:MAG: hypothetical protein SLRJCFUN_000359 [Candidatus Fervidibacter sp.]
MACADEHLFALDYAMRHCSWLPDDRWGYRGWRAGKDDIFNRLTLLPDIVHDWLWQKFPYAPSVIAYGLRCLRQDWQRGDKRSVALKLALLSHYLHDIVAVSHTWLDFCGDEVDFVRGAFSHFHDPVENRMTRFLPTLIVPTPKVDGDFVAVFRTALRRAYELGKAIFDAYFASLHRFAPKATEEAITPPLEALDEWQKEGIVNACFAVWALWELGVQGETELPFDEDDVRRWTLKPLMESSADEIEAAVQLEGLGERVAEWQQKQGWKGSDIFRAHERCSEEAVREYQRWQRKRDEWRQKEMAGILPPRPSIPITVHWRPTEVKAL